MEEGIISERGHCRLTRWCPQRQTQLVVRFSIDWNDIHEGCWGRGVCTCCLSEGRTEIYSLGTWKKSNKNVPLLWGNSLHSYCTSTHRPQHGFGWESTYFCTTWFPNQNFLRSLLHLVNSCSNSRLSTVVTSQPFLSRPNAWWCDLPYSLLSQNLPHLQFTFL